MNTRASRSAIIVVDTREGVFGNENSKWYDPKDYRVLGPEHNVTLPFTRMVAGPLDYTPGAMRNASKGTWAAVWNNPEDDVYDAL